MTRRADFAAASGTIKASPAAPKPVNHLRDAPSRVPQYSDTEGRTENTTWCGEPHTLESTETAVCEGVIHIGPAAPLVETAGTTTTPQETPHASARDLLLSSHSTPTRNWVAIVQTHPTRPPSLWLSTITSPRRWNPKTQMDSKTGEVGTSNRGANRSRDLYPPGTGPQIYQIPKRLYPLSSTNKMENKGGLLIPVKTPTGKISPTTQGTAPTAPSTPTPIGLTHHIPAFEAQILPPGAPMSQG